MTFPALVDGPTVPVAQALRRARDPADVLHRRATASCAAASTASGRPRRRSTDRCDDDPRRSRSRPADRYSSQRNQRAAASGRARSPTPRARRAARSGTRCGRSTARTRLRERGGREQLGERLERRRAAWRAGTPCRRGTAARGTAPLAAREVRLGAQRARHQHPDARRTRPCRAAAAERGRRRRPARPSRARRR